jgi:hemoglobin-like flavoprotein
MLPRIWGKGYFMPIAFIHSTTPTIKQNGNKYIAKNGDALYENNGNIVRVDFNTKKSTILPQKEMLELGIASVSYHPDVHIPLPELADVIKKIEG